MRGDEKDRDEIYDDVVREMIARGELDPDYMPDDSGWDLIDDYLLYSRSDAFDSQIAYDDVVPFIANADFDDVDEEDDIYDFGFEL